jgi:hypothetical protein
MPPEKLGALRCPKCGNDVSEGGDIRYIETIENYRRVRSVENGQLRVDSFYETGDGYDEGKNPEFECQWYDAQGHTCGHRWSVPDWIQCLIDWV